MPEILFFEEQYPEETRAFERKSISDRKSRPNWLAGLNLNAEAGKQAEIPSFDLVLREAFANSRSLILNIPSRELFADLITSAPSNETEFSQQLPNLKKAYYFLAKNKSQPQIVLHPIMSVNRWMNLINLNKNYIRLVDNYGITPYEYLYGSWNLTVINATKVPQLTDINIDMTSGSRLSETKKFLSEFKHSIAGTPTTKDNSINGLANLTQYLAAQWYLRENNMQLLDEGTSMTQLVGPELWVSFTGTDLSLSRPDSQIDNPKIGFRPAYSIERNSYSFKRQARIKKIVQRPGRTLPIKRYGNIEKRIS